MDINAKWETVESETGLSSATVKVLIDNGIETMADFLACDPEQVTALRKPGRVNIGQRKRLQLVFSKPTLHKNVEKCLFGGISEQINPCKTNQIYTFYNVDTNIFHLI